MVYIYTLHFPDKSYIRPIACVLVEVARLTRAVETSSYEYDRIHPS